jgi:predicted metal-dependent hydrolase
MSPVQQLDLFGPDDASPGPAVPPAPPERRPEAMAPIVTTCPPDLPAGARWREVRTPDQVIGFVLRRSRRKSIGLVVNDDGLQITAPGWVTLSQIDATIVEKSRWILKKLQVRQARQEQLAMADTHWQDGGTIPYLGKNIVLRLGEAPHGHRFEGRAFAPEQGDALLLPLPRQADHHRVRDSAHAWLQLQAKDWFGQRLEHFQQTSQLRARRWRLSSAATRWGSCNSDGNIMLNWRLIHFDHAIIDYVIVHEIAHLKELNHSKDFWREVERILPGFEQARNALRQHDPATLPLI